jgi:hypothetical protein
LEECQPAIEERDLLRRHGLGLIEEEAANYFAAIQSKWLMNPHNLDVSELAKSLAEEQSIKLRKEYHQLLDADKVFLKKIREAVSFIASENMKVFICICIGTCSFTTFLHVLQVKARFEMKEMADEFRNATSALSTANKKMKADDENEANLAGRGEDNVREAEKLPEAKDNVDENKNDIKTSPATSPADPFAGYTGFSKRGFYERDPWDAESDEDGL